MRDGGSAEKGEKEEVVSLGKWVGIRAIRARSMHPTLTDLNATASKYNLGGGGGGGGGGGLMTGDCSRATRAKLANVTIRPIVVKDRVRAQCVRDLVAASLSAPAPVAPASSGEEEDEGERVGKSALLDQHVQLLSFTPTAPSVYPDPFFPSVHVGEGDTDQQQQQQQPPPGAEGKASNPYYPQPHHAVQVTYRVTAINRHGAGRPGLLGDAMCAGHNQTPSTAEHTQLGMYHPWRTIAVLLRDVDLAAAHLLPSEDAPQRDTETETGKFDVMYHAAADMESVHDVDNDSGMAGLAEGEEGVKPLSAPSLAVQCHPASALFPPSIQDRSPYI